MTKILSHDETSDALATITPWKKVGTTITRDLVTADFPAALGLVVEIGVLAEKAFHHPDIDIRYNKIHLVLTTHDAGGLTKKDIALATEIERALKARHG